MDIYIQHINRRQSLIVQNIVLEESDEDDEIIEEYQTAVGGTVYVSADSDPNVIRINTWN